MPKPWAIANIVSTRRALKSTVLLLVILVGVAVVLAATGPWPFAGTRPAVLQDGDLLPLQDEIRGLDQNVDGIRDDVEEWIRGRTAEASPERQALLQLAADYQRVLMTAGSEQASLQSLDRLSESLSCLRSVLKAGAEPEIVQLKAVVLDSDVRVRAWLKAYERLEKAGLGTPPAVPTSSGCRF